MTETQRESVRNLNSGRGSHDELELSQSKLVPLKAVSGETNTPMKRESEVFEVDEECN